MNWKKIGRAALCLLVVCCLILNMSPVQVKALDPVTVSMGVVAGVSALLGVGAIMVGLGVMPKNTTSSKDAFWDLAGDIFESLPESMKVTYVVASLGAQTFLKSWYYKDTYFFHEQVVKAVNSRIHTGTISVDSSTGKVSSSAPVSCVPDFGSQTSVATKYGDVISYVNQNLSGIYNYCSSARYCTYVQSALGQDQFWFTDEELSYSENKSGFWDIAYYGDTFKCLQYDTDTGAWKTVTSYPTVNTITDVLSFSASYRSNYDVKLGTVDSVVIPFNGTGALEIDDDQPDYGDEDGGDDDGGKYYPVTLPGNKGDIEDMDQDEAQAGNSGDIDIGVDYDTGEPLKDFANCKAVAVDAQIAVASILIALGISPGTTNTDFRALIDSIIAELPDSYFYPYDSLAYGSMSLLRCWLCDDTYYVTKDVLEYINDLLYNGSDTMDSIFTVGQYPVDLGKYPEYTSFLSVIDSYRNSDKAYQQEYAGYFDNSVYFCAVHTDYNGTVFACSDLPILFDGYQPYSTTKFYVEGNNVYSYWSSGVLKISSYSNKYHFAIANSAHQDSEFYDFYERGLSVAGNLIVSDSSSSFSDLSYRFFTAFVDDLTLQLYPIKLFETLEAAEAAIQTEVQAGSNSSTSITVDVSTGEIVDVLPGIDPEPDSTIPVPDPDPDPDTTTPVPDPGTGDDTGSDSGTSSDTLEEILQGHRTGLLDGLRSFFEWLGNFIVSGFNNAIEWLGDTIVAGYRRVTEWLSDTLLAGIRSIIEWLADAILGGIRDIFFPSEDFLTAKVEALRARFSFADSIIATVAAMGGALNDFETSPPIIYMELSEAESKYDWGDRAIALDLRWYERYKPTVDALLSALLWIFFVWRVFRKLPGIISGVEGDTPFANIVREGFSSMKRRE